VAFVPEAAGVVGEEPGIEGNDSRRDAPNEEDGLNGLRPANPVKCGLSGAAEGGGETENEGVDEVAVAPVG